MRLGAIPPLEESLRLVEVNRLDAQRRMLQSRVDVLILEGLRRTNPKQADKRYHGRKVSLEASPSSQGDIPEKDMPEEKSEEWH